MKRAIPAALILAAAFAVGGASPAETAAKERHTRFETIGRAFKGINDQLKRRPDDLAAIRNTTAVLAVLASRVKTWFPEGSGPQHGVTTDARAAVWTDRSKFDSEADRFALAARDLAAAAEAGNLPAIRAAVRATGETCKSCHDQFRK